MPSSSTALNLGLWDVPFRGQSFGPLTLAYQSDVEAVSAISPQALTAVNNLLYAEYSNGAGGTGKVADFIDDIDYLWPCMGDDLTAALVCVKGSNTNNGFVNGDYSQSVGLAGDNSSYIVTDQAAASELNFNDLGISISVRLSETIETFDRLWAYVSFGWEVDERSNSISITANLNGGTQNIGAMAGQQARILINRSQANSYKVKFNGSDSVISSSQTTSTTTSTEKLTLYAQTTGGRPTTAVFRFTAKHKGLTDNQLTILDNAIAAFDAARGNL